MSKTKHTELPSGWEMKELGKLCNLVTKGTTPKKFSENGIRYIKIEAFEENFISLDKCVFIDEKTHAMELKRSILQENDILFAIAGATIGKTNVVTKEVLPANTNQALAILRLNSQKFREYILQVLKSQIMQKYIQNSISTGAQPNLNLEQMNNFSFPLPPLPEQRAIANILSTWDTAIQTTQALISQKELEKKWLMQNLLTGKKRLKGFSGEWKEMKLSELFSPLKDINDGGDSHSIMTISSKLGLISQEDKFDRVIAGDSLKKYTQIKKGDFAYNKGNSKTYPMGCIYQLEEKESALVPFVYICFRPKEIVDGSFFKQWFLDHGLDRQLNQIITSGARGDGLLNVNTDDFFNLKVPYPQFEEQTAIAQVLQTADKELDLLKTKLEQQKLQKKGLMQVLLTGKVRVNKIQEYENR
jgi:type I restriction enzyme S subunit